MQTTDFHFDLPEHLIAQTPLPNRSDSKLLVYQRATQTIQHHTFHQLAQFLRPGDLLVFNDSRVFPARFFGQKETGGKVEGLVERFLSGTCFLAHLKANKPLAIGTRFTLSDAAFIQIEAREGALFRCQSNTPMQALLAVKGHIPLPPYIRRPADLTDVARYQTLYANPVGSVAAPTAGLHFDDKTFAQLTAAGIQLGYVTLHVGAGTFQPVRVERLIDHVMHAEYIHITDALCQQVAETRAKGGRVIAVGTTALRALESAATSGTLQPFEGETSIFIYPGSTFKVVQGLLTNFHLPASTLLMLVSAFIGTLETKRLYQTAIAHHYRFYSYGDASLLL